MPSNIPFQGFRRLDRAMEKIVVIFLLSLGIVALNEVDASRGGISMFSSSKLSVSEQRTDPHSYGRHELDALAKRLRNTRLLRDNVADAKSERIATEAPSGSNRVFYVTDDGADPSGQNDSTDALQSTIERAFRVATNWSLLVGVTDLGGVEVHLCGGEYIISRPLSMPRIGGGNILIHGGTIRASATFPQDGYLIQLASLLGSKAVANGSFTVSADQNNAVVYENIKLRDLMLDASYIAGGVLIEDSLRISIDSCYITHFRTQGIVVVRGHETLVRSSFLGQHITQGGDPQERTFGGIGIDLMGNDNVITDVVIFSAAVGIAIRGQANILTGVHCYNKATFFGGVGIHLQLPGNTQTRIVGCYMDFTSIVMDDPSQVTVTNTFFLGDANVVLRATSARHSIYGVVIVDNMFSGSNGQVPIVQLDESAANFTSVEQTVVERNSVTGMLLRSTKATSSASAFATNWTIDFSPVLLFPDLIVDVHYSFQSVNTCADMFPRHAIRSITNNQVIIMSDIPVNATVTATVDQSKI